MKKLVIGLLALGSISAHALPNDSYEVKEGDRIVLLKSSGNSAQGNSIRDLIAQCKELSGELLSSPKCNESGYVDARYGDIKCFQICKY